MTAPVGRLLSVVFDCADPAGHPFCLIVQAEPDLPA